MNKLEIKNYNISELKPYEKNARKHEQKDIETIKNSIKEFGFNDPIGIWSEKNIIVEGHGRYFAAKELGIDTIPCIRLDHLTDEQRRAYALAHNKTAEMSKWDFDLVASEICDIDLDMEQFGFEIEVEEDEKNVKEDEFDVEENIPEEPISKYGDIWKLGSHRLMCGDSTIKEYYLKLMDGDVADLVFTDPPYGMKKEKDGVMNDNLNYEDLLDFNKKWIPLTFEFSKDTGSWYCWGIDEPLMDIYANILKPMIKENKITFRNLITWDKGFGQGQLSDEFRKYPIADEKCLFVMCGVQGFNTNADNYYEGWEPIRKYLVDSKNEMGWKDEDIIRITGVTSVARHAFGKSQWCFPTEEHYKKLQEHARGEAFKRDYEDLKRDYEDLKRDYEDLKRDYYSTRAYFDNTHDNMNNVWKFQRANNQERELTGGHATPKPLALCGRAIKSSSRENEIVLDVFGGSGSTLIACEQLNRKCYMMELDPKYVDVIIKRWETLTGKKAELL